ncbi:MAG: hypothetical protein ACLVCW_07735 [Campylobacter sp.]
MKFRVKFRLICGRGLKFNGANLDFILNQRLKVRLGAALGIKFIFVRVVLGTEFTALWMKFYAKAHRRGGEKSLAVYKFHVPLYKTEIKILISSPP